MTYLFFLVTGRFVTLSAKGTLNAARQSGGKRVPLHVCGPRALGGAPGTSIMNGKEVFDAWTYDPPHLLNRRTLKYYRRYRYDRVRADRGVSVVRRLLHDPFDDHHHWGPGDQ